ncbi:MAG: Gfo/Idh/MocA family oxidoreductase [Desulfobacterales bacterium]|jgi:predicted dehydrogenase
MTEKKTVRVALIGAGAWSGAVCNAIMKSKKVELVTCFDVIPEKHQALSDKFGCSYEASYEDVLKRNDIDAVHLISPNAVHAEQAILAARHGKHVFVEKPLANTIPDAKNTIAACQKANVVLMVGQHLRRLAGFRKLKALIAGGAIGEPIQVEANFSQNLGFALTPESFRWRGDDSGCPAGALMTLGIHHADLLNYLLGPIETVFAYFNKLYIKAPVEDVNTTICQFKSGVLGYLGTNYASPKSCWVSVYGTEANLRCTVTLQELPFEAYLLRWQMIDEDTRVQIFKKDRTGGEDIALNIGNPILEEIDEFADCIRTGKKPETDGEGGLQALAFIRAAIESARTGKQARIEA